MQTVIDLHPYSYMERRRFLKCVRNAYDDKSTAYLIALRDALSVVISLRINRNATPIEMYGGYVKYE